EGVAPWSDLPVWVPATGDEVGFSSIDCRKAIAAGLAFRPAVDTARDTLAWWQTLPEERRAKLRAGLSPEREAEVLAKWKARGR
ncbi:MAG TPA: epimerase, partial [Planctomycetota bacterium]|nr:epimerase [Planctomycetota bacterium]